MKSWQEKVAVFRHGTPCAAELLTQVDWKAPKYSFSGRPKEKQESGVGPVAVPPTDQYPRAPKYSFGTPADHSRRPQSAPPGLRNIPLKPTTPSWGFGTTGRPPAFRGEPGPGPCAPGPGMGGPKYSLRQRHRERKPDPTPGLINPGGQASRRGPKWAPGRDPTRRRSGPGPSYCHPPFGGGPAYSVRPRRPDKEDDTWRPLGHQYTYFGYNDYGRSGQYDCACMHHEDPAKAVTQSRPSRARPTSAPAGGRRRVARPTSAPAGGRGRVAPQRSESLHQVVHEFG